MRQWILLKKGRKLEDHDCLRSCDDDEDKSAVKRKGYSAATGYSLDNLLDLIDSGLSCPISASLLIVFAFASFFQPCCNLYA